MSVIKLTTTHMRIFHLCQQRSSTSRRRKRVGLCAILDPILFGGDRDCGGFVVRPLHVDVGQDHPLRLIVPPQPVPRAPSRPAVCVPPHQHEVVRVGQNELCVVRVHGHARLVVEPTHVAQSHVGHPIPETTYYIIGILLPPASMISAKNIKPLLIC